MAHLLGGAAESGKTRARSSGVQWQTVEHDDGAGDTKAIDPWVNLGMLAGQAAPRVAGAREGGLLQGRRGLPQGSLTPAELIAQMDEAGVEKVVLSLQLDAPQESVIECARLYPERIFMAADL